MLLDASRSHDIGTLVESRAKGHKGLLPFQVSRLAREAAGREAQSWPSGEHRGIPRLSLSLSEGLHCLQSWLCFVLFIIAYRPLSELPLPVPISGVIYMARSMEIGKKSPRLLGMHSPAHLA